MKTDVGRLDCYPPGWPCCPHYQPVENTIHTRLPSVQEQLGVDPVSKLAAAIERLADALERTSHAASE